MSTPGSAGRSCTARHASATHPRSSLKASGDLPDLEGLDDVALMDVLEVLEPDPALEALVHLPHVVLEPAEGADPSRVDDDPVSDQPGLGSPCDLPAEHHAPGDHPARGPEQR